MNIKSFKIAVAALIVSWMSGLQAHAQQPATLFQYPQIPDSITDVHQRYDYFVSHFWDRCDMKTAFSSRARLADAFADYLSPMTQASADTVYRSIDKFMASMAKNPDRQLFFAQLAEKELYSDSAMIVSDDLYRAFIKPVIANKKVDKAMKARMEMQNRQLRNSRVGYPIPRLDFTSRDGSATQFTPTTGIPTVIFLYEDDCMDCNMARIRLQSDASTRDLVDSGAVAMVALTAADDTPEWREHAAAFPQSWTVGAYPDLDMVLDMRGGTPAFYVLDENGLLIAKNIGLEPIINLMRNLNR